MKKESARCFSLSESIFIWTKGSRAAGVAEVDAIWDDDSAWVDWMGNIEFGASAGRSPVNENGGVTETGAVCLGVSVGGQVGLSVLFISLVFCFIVVSR